MLHAHFNEKTKLIYCQIRLCHATVYSDSVQLTQSLMSIKMSKIEILYLRIGVEVRANRHMVTNKVPRSGRNTNYMLPFKHMS